MSRFDELPNTLKAAIVLLCVYAVAVLINAVIGQMATDWVDAADFPRGLVRTGGCLCLAWWLTKEDKRAWWLGVLLIGFWVVLGVGTLGLFEYLSATSPEVATIELPLYTYPAFAMLAAIEILLLMPSSRAYFASE